MYVSVLTQLLFVYIFYGICHTSQENYNLVSQHVENSDFKHTVNA